MDLKGEIKLTNISTERNLNLEPRGQVFLKDLLHINPMFFFNKNRVWYKANDDMYGVGVMMWELWTREPVSSLNFVETIPDNQTQADVERFKQELEQLQPKESPYFNVTVDNLYKEFVKDWWKTIHACLGREMSSKDLEIKLDQIYTFPSLTKVEECSFLSEKHF